MIKIINNFFDENQYNKIIYHIKNKIYFSPRFYRDTTEKTKDNNYGNRFILKNDKSFYETQSQTAKNNFEHFFGESEYLDKWKKIKEVIKNLND